MYYTKTVDNQFGEIVHASAWSSKEAFEKQAAYLGRFFRSRTTTVPCTKEEFDAAEVRYQRHDL